MYNKLLEVNMDAVLFNTSEKTTLITHGVTTCIAFIIQGSFWDEDEEETTKFCGLFHWSGFNSYPADPDEQARDALLFFLDRLNIFSGVEDDAHIHIESLHFIGGEREQRDVNNEVIVSGTENEVTSLVRIVSKFKFSDYGFNIKPNAIKHDHFLTKDEQSISISLTIESCHFEIKKPSTELTNRSLGLFF